MDIKNTVVAGQVQTVFMFIGIILQPLFFMTVTQLICLVLALQ